MSVTIRCRKGQVTDYHKGIVKSKWSQRQIVIDSLTQVDPVPCQWTVGSGHTSAG